MASQKTRWGVVFYVSAFFLAGFLFLLYARLPFGAYKAFYTFTVPWTGLILSAAAFFIGHFSYPRIHNQKAYLGGYLAGITGVAIFAAGYLADAYGIIPMPVSYLRALYGLIFANFLLLSLIPSYVKYRITRMVTLSVVAAEAVVIILFRAAPQTASWAAVFRFNGWLHYSVYIGPLCVAAVTALLVRCVKHEFYLGGILGGTTVLYGAALLLRQIHPDGEEIQKLILAAAPLFLEIGIAFHWILRMEHRVAYDPLLHIYNRDYCGQIVSERSSINSAPPFSVAMVDIDHFKRVNDTYGHQTGDLVLQSVAQVVSREVVPDGTVCRYGGEELVVFFPQTGQKQARTIMEKVRLAVGRAKTESGNKTVRVTVSCGVSCIEEPGQTIKSAIEAADKALYRAKNGGRNQVRTGKAPAPRKKG